MSEHGDKLPAVEDPLHQDAAGEAGIRFNLLGPLESVSAGVALPFRGTKPRALLAYLLLHCNETVTTSTLIRAIWGATPPATARKMLHNAVAAVRLVLSATSSDPSQPKLLTQPSGYLLKVLPQRIDVVLFRAWIAVGRSAFANKEWETAAHHLRAGLDLWRGTVLSDLTEQGVDWPELGVLTAARHSAFDDWIEVMLTLGRHREALSELEGGLWTGLNRERSSNRLIIALYRCGRESDALDACRQAIARAQGHGTSVVELRRLERAIIDHDPLIASTSIPQNSAFETSEVEMGMTHTRAIPTLGKSPSTRRERKWVSVLLVHLRVENERITSDPELLHETWQASSRVVRSVVEPFGGFVHATMGPIAVVVFGLNRTFEDDAERAIRGGLAIRHRMHTNTFDLRHLKVGLSVATGEALVNPSDVHEASEISGAVIDTAMALLRLVPDGQLCVCDTSRLASRGAVMYAEDNYSHTNTVLSVRPEEVSSTSMIRYVERASEHRILNMLLEGLIREHRTHRVTLVGETGMGKSRLAREVFQGAEGTRVLFGRTPRFGGVVRANPLAAVLRNYCSIVVDDDTDSIERKLGISIRQLIGEGDVADWLLVHLRTLLVSSQRPDTDSVDQFMAWGRFLTEIARFTPAVLVLEDIHAADDDFLDFVENLPMYISSSVGVLVVLTARHELLSRRPQWNSGELDVTSVMVGPFDAARTSYLVQALVQYEATHRIFGDFADEQVEEIASRAEMLLDEIGGNPLFAIEFVRMLWEEFLPAILRSTPTVDVARADNPFGDAETQRIPQSVYNILAARLDSLSSLEKEVLQHSAVMGIAFRSASLAASLNLEADAVSIALQSLQKSGIVVGMGSTLDGSATYGFRNSLVRDVTYTRIPRIQREELRGRIGMQHDHNRMEPR